MLKSFEGRGLGRSCCPWLPETAGEGASAQLGGVPDLLRRGDLRLHGQPGRRGEVGPLGGVPQPGGDAEAAGLGLQRGRRCRREGSRRQESLPGDFQPCLSFNIPLQTTPGSCQLVPYEVLGLHLGQGLELQRGRAMGLRF